jgi:hypothetical protein
VGSVSRQQRHLRAHSCLICGGYDEEDRGNGTRCWGYLSGDGEYVHCSNDGYAGSLELNPKDQTYRHRLTGDCCCGKRHGSLPAPQPTGSNGHHPKREVDRYNYTDEDGKTLYQVRKYDDGTYSQHRPDGNGGWIQGLKGEDRRPLFRLPEILEALTKDDHTICIAEGEKDVLTLVRYGYDATTNSGGADKWRDEHSETLRGAQDIVIFPDNDVPGRRHLATVARSLQQRIGITPRVVQMDGLPEHGDISDWMKGRNQDDLDALVQMAPKYEAETPALSTATSPESDKNPWRHIQSVPDFLSKERPQFQGIVKDLLKAGALTVISAPRGIGKSNTSYALAVALANGGVFRGEQLTPCRMLLLDRDNPEGTLEIQLRGWGGDEAPQFDVLTREHCPDLLDTKAWALLPAEQYAVIIVDSIGTFTEGVTEREGKETTQVIARLKDLALRGPAVLALWNPDKDAKSIRGRGEWMNAADAIYEVRDATDFTPSGKQDWWKELPDAAESAWADRAARRARRTVYRNAFVPSKSRLGGPEPEPFCLELRYPTDAPWSVVDVTNDIIAAGTQSAEERERHKAEQFDAMIKDLQRVITERHAKGQPLFKTEAVEYLRDIHRMGRDKAREVIEKSKTIFWNTEKGVGQGHPEWLLPVTPTE